MKWQAMFILFSLLPIVMIASGQTPSANQSSAQDTQTHGYWLDSSTGLMWTAKDNGKDISYRNAIRYCRNLRLAGYSDWRLANMWNLQGMYDSKANAPGLAGPGKESNSTWHIKGNLFLTGYQWSRTIDDRGHIWDYPYYFDFNEGKSNDQPSGPFYSFVFMRALCVRGGSD